MKLLYNKTNLNYYNLWKIVAFFSIYLVFLIKIKVPLL